MGKPIVFTWELQGLDELADRMDELKQKIELKCDEFAERLGALGVRIASMYYQQASYAGQNDVEVHLEPGNTAGSVTIVAEGQTVLFIEFGTGVTMPDAPEARAELKSGNILGHGEYGQHRGASPKGWYYPKSKGYGANPPIGTEDATRPGMENFIHTYGNPAYPAMYMTRRDLIDNIERIAREVFK